MRLRRRLVTIPLIIIAVLAAAFFVIGPERLWEQFGPADLGPVTFETLERRTTPNDALACPPGICKAQSDMTPPEYATSAKSLRYWFGQAIASESRLTAIVS